MKNHIYFFLVIGCFLTQLTSTYASIDTIPYRIKTHIDTVTIFDAETFEETVKVVEWEEYFVQSMDTMIIFDPKTKEEKIRVVKGYNELKKYIENLEKKEPQFVKTTELDTIVVFDSESYEETYNVIPRTHPCYYLSWGNRAFTTDSSLSQKELRKAIRKPFNFWALNRECDKTPDFSFSFVFQTKAGNARMFNISKAGNTLPVDFISEELIKPGARIIIHDIIIDQNESFGDINLMVR